MFTAAGFRGLPPLCGFHPARWSTALLRCAPCAGRTYRYGTQCQVPNLIKQKTQVEIENGAAVDDIYTQYFSDMLQGKLSIEEGVEQLSKSWRSQGGEEILEAVNAEYQKTKAKQ